MLRAFHTLQVETGGWRQGSHGEDTGGIWRKVVVPEAVGPGDGAAVQRAGRSRRRPGCSATGSWPHQQGVRDPRNGDQRGTHSPPATAARTAATTATTSSSAGTRPAWSRRWRCRPSNPRRSRWSEGEGERRDGRQRWIGPWRQAWRGRGRGGQWRQGCRWRGGARGGATDRSLGAAAQCLRCGPSPPLPPPGLHRVARQPHPRGNLHRGSPLPHHHPHRPRLQDPCGAQRALPGGWRPAPGFHLHPPRPLAGGCRPTLRRAAQPWVRPHEQCHGPLVV